MVELGETVTVRFDGVSFGVVGQVLAVQAGSGQAERYQGGLI